MRLMTRRAGRASSLNSLREDSMDLDQVIAALRGMRPPLITQETDLHGLVSKTLEGAKITHTAEYRIDLIGRSSLRIDFLTAGGTGIECKKGKPNRTRLLEQLYRYGESDDVCALVVVTPWGRHLNLPRNFYGKPLEIIVLNRLWGVST